MRFFKKKDETNPVEVRRTRSHGHVFDHSHDRPSPSNWNRNDPGGTSKRSILELAKMLNCAAGKAMEEDFVPGEQSFRVGGSDDYVKIPGMLKRSSSWGGTLRKNNAAIYDSDIIRPVLITIKDGGLGASMSGRVGSWYPSENTEAMRELENSFLIGPPAPTSKAKSSSFLFGSSARKRPTEKESLFAKHINDKSQTEGSENHNNSPPPTSSQNNATSLHSPRDIARKERWKRGLEMERKVWRSRNSNAANGNQSTISSSFGASTDGEDSIYAGEDRSYFTRSTEGTSYYTDEDFSSLGESITEATETDESGDYSRYYMRNRNKNRSLVRSSSELEYLLAFGISEGHCSSQHQLIREISEDLGLFASLLLADGTACLGTAAAITRETVTGCKPDP